MSRQLEKSHAAVGFRVKSGFAVAVLLAGPIESPRVLDRRVVLLSDPDVPETKQPYHASMGTLEEDQAAIRSRIKIIERAAKQSVREFLDGCRDIGVRPVGARLVVGSQIDPKKIANPHIRAHAYEGQVFPRALADALEAQGFRSELMLERDAYKQGALALARSEPDLKRALAELRKVVDGPWRAEEKLAALAAWLALAGNP